MQLAHPNECCNHRNCKIVGQVEHPCKQISLCPCFGMGRQFKGDFGLQQYGKSLSNKMHLADVALPCLPMHACHACHACQSEVYECFLTFPPAYLWMSRPIQTVNDSVWNALPLAWLRSPCLNSQLAAVCHCEYVMQ